MFTSVYIAAVPTGASKVLNVCVYIYIYMRVHNRILNVVATGNIIQQAQTHLWPP